MESTMASNEITDQLDVLMSNVVGSYPGYDESYGPRVLQDFFGNEILYVPVDEIAEEDSPLRFVVSGAEDPEDRERRLYAVDLSDPLAVDETENDAREAMQVSSLVTVDSDYVSNLGPSKIACRCFSEQEVLPPMPGVAIVPIKKFDRKTKKWVPVLTHVAVSVRKTRTRH
jgi:hypothetical protein